MREETPIRREVQGFVRIRAASRECGTADRNDTAEEVIARLGAKRRVAREAQMEDAASVVRALERVDDRAAHQRHAAGAGLDPRMGFDPLDRHREPRLDRIAGPPGSA